MKSIPVPPVPPAQPMPLVNDRKGLAIASLVLGILSLCLVWFPVVGVVGLIGSVIGLVLGIMGLKSSLKGIAIAGIVISGISLLIGIVTVVVIGGLMLLGPAIGNVFTEINSSMIAP